MNIRQIKKQYKRIHGFNPPKGYSRAQIRKSLKMNSLQNFIAITYFRLSEAANTAVKILNDFAAKLKELKQID